MSAGSSEYSNFDLPTVLQGLGDGVALANAEGRIVFMNEAAGRILGNSATDAPPEDWTDHYGVFLPDGETPFPTERYPLVRAIQGEVTRDVEMRIRSPNLPREAFIWVSGRPLRGPDGEITGAAVVFRDVTELRRTRAELERANRELLETQRRKEELSSFVVHDLKNPITNVMAIAEILFHADEDTLDAKRVRSDALIVHEAASLMDRMVLDILDVQLGEDGRLEPRFESVGIADLFAQVVRGVSSRASGITATELDPELRVRADRSLLFRVLANLVDNSLKYGPEDGRVELGGERTTEGMVRLWVEDEGPGVPQALRESIFEKYARIEHPGSARRHRSRGLGLRFCRVAVDALGGSIRVEGREPVGARFVVELPAD